MKRGASIRGRLAFNTSLVGVLLFVLAVGYGWSFWSLGESLRHMYEIEVKPQSNLVRMERDLLKIHERMQGVMLSHASSQGALNMLVLQHADIHEQWEHFNDRHRVLRGDPVEQDLMDTVDTGLQMLDELVIRLRIAYQIYDPVDLSSMLEQDWYSIDLGLVYPLRELIDRQSGHAQTSYEEFVSSRNLYGVLFSAGLLIVWIVTAGGAFAVSRYVSRRISVIERSLEAVSRGERGVDVQFPVAELEMGRIAGAINRTVLKLAADHAAIEKLVDTNAAVLGSVPDGIYGVDTAGTTVFVNAACCGLLGYTENELYGAASHPLFHHTRPDGSPYPQDECPIFLSRQRQETIVRNDEVFFRKDGSSFPVEYTATPMSDHHGGYRGTVVVFRDITERQAQEKRLSDAVNRLQEGNRRLQDLQGQLLQSEKLASIGQLAAGVAHEINNPVGFVSSNLSTLQNYADTMLKALGEVSEAVGTGEGLSSEQGAALRERLQADDMEYLQEDLLALIRESRDGLDRIKKIVLDLKNFARVDQGEWQPSDLNAGIESTLNVVWNELKYKTNVEKSLGNLPLVTCDLGKINQVFMNLLVNAGHAIKDRGVIALKSWEENGYVFVSVSDTGSGIAPEVIEKIFDPFFTTKAIGKGTGLGLSLAWGIVHDHGGRIDVDSTVGEGTTFTVVLPIEGKRPVEDKSST